MKRRSTRPPFRPLQFRPWRGGRGLTSVMFILALCLLLPAAAQPPEGRYLGVDLSYANEMEDCGAVYTAGGEARDVYQIFADAGANLVRARLWVNPDWTRYSTLGDVIETLRRAQDAGMSTLLDFHYSDTWADPSKQIIPALWAGMDDTQLAVAVYDYTYGVLHYLDTLGLMPDMVQVGNEINSEVLRAEGSSGYPINWDRNAALINAGIRGVRDASDAKIILHIAQPENAEGWLRSANRAGVTDYDIIGISYYPGWSDHTLRTIDNVTSRLRERFGKDVLYVETAYPWTLRGKSESAGNVLGADFLADGYDASPQGQRQFLIDLNQAVFDAGGLGTVYWAPEWISTGCRTLWGTGSHWENATVFDFDGEAHAGIEYLSHPYTVPPAQD